MGFTLFISAVLTLTAPPIVSAQGQDSLTVRVRDIADNSAIQGATVRLYNQNGTLYDEQVTGEDGIVGISFSTTSAPLDVQFTTKLGTPYPNPFGAHTSVPVSLKSTSRLSGTLYDLLGKPVASGEALLGPGTHAFDVRMGSLPAGAYIFRLTNNGQEVGSVVLRHTGEGVREETDVHVLRGAGTFVPGTDKAVAGTFRLEVTHENYASFVDDALEVNGKTVKVVQVKRVEFVAEFGDEETRKFTVVANAQDGLSVPRDLEFHPTRANELWTVNRSFDGTVTFYNAGTEQQIADRRQDVYGNHFMEEVSAIAFSENDFFGTAQETNNTYNNQAPGNNFMGPALWIADTSIYDRVHQNDQLLGSHMDMLHESPYGMGMAHDHDNAYWYFDGYYGNIVYYDFGEDHGPGEDDHSDGIVRRYVDARVTRVPGIPGHMILDKQTGWLYTCDPGGRRITRLNTKTGSNVGNGNFDGSQMEPLTEYSRYGGATYEVLVSDGVQRPSGIVLHEGRLFVTDNWTNEIIAYDLDGKELNRIQTPGESIMGITVGPDGKLWYVDAEADQVVRLDP